MLAELMGRGPVFLLAALAAGCGAPSSLPDGGSGGSTLVLTCNGDSVTFTRQG
jgi:hypothetical protein